MTTVEFAIGEWEVGQFRATTFHLPGSDLLDRTGLWQEVVGTSPESIDSRPRERLMRQVGSLGDSQLLLIVRSDRVDWILQPLVGPQNQPPEVLPTLGSDRDSLVRFQRVVESWLVQSPPVTRLAFGSVLVFGVADLRAGYLQLSNYLPKLELDKEEGIDFLFQINRPRMSKVVPNVKINRLTKWSIMQVGAISINIGTSAVPTLGATPLSLARRLELDINTAPESTNEVSRTQAHSLFREFMTLGSEVATKGDDS